MEEQDLKSILKEILDLSALKAKLEMQLTKNKIKETTANTIENAKTGLDNKIKATGVAIKEGSEEHTKYIEEKATIIEMYEEAQDALSEKHLENMKEKELLIAELEGKKVTTIAEMNEAKKEKKEYSKNGTLETNQELKTLNSKVKELKKEAIKEMKAGNYERVAEITNECSSLTPEIEKLENTKSEEYVRLNGNIDLKKEEIEEIKTQIEELKTQKKELEEQYKKDSEELSGEKKNEIAVLNQKTPLFKRITNKLSSMFMSSKAKHEKISEEVLKPAGNKVTEFITKKIPEMAIGAVSKTKEFVQGIKDSAVKGKEDFDTKLNEKLSTHRDNLKDKIEKIQEEIGNSNLKGQEEVEEQKEDEGR